MISTCIIGSGPSGFYTAKYLLKKVPNIRISMFHFVKKKILKKSVEELPCPFGLVRYGVAPDHLETKNVMNDFSTVLLDERVSYYGNVSVGEKRKESKDKKHVSLKELRDMFDSVVLSCGASSDRMLKLQHEDDCDNILSAREFVNWYNGHPWYTNQPKYAQLLRNVSDKNSKDTLHIVVIGNGNVALDCIRVLCCSLDRLHNKSDMPGHVIHALHPRTKRFHISAIGRRGLLQASFTNKELRELIDNKNVNTNNDNTNPLEPNYQCFLFQNELHDSLNDASKQEAKEDRATQRKLDIFQKCAILPSSSSSSSSSSSFLLVLERRITKLLCRRNILKGSAFQQTAESVVATDPNSLVEFPCDLLLRSVGYQATPIDQSLLSSAWDQKQHCVANTFGQIVGEPLLYATGWCGRAPNGIIGTNIQDAQQVVNSLVSDLEKGVFQSKRSVIQ
ncbi:NADP-dependent ferredoxin reductase and adrenodoxin reductase, fprA-like protein, partial [Reticulomyxa filosa]